MCWDLGTFFDSENNISVYLDRLFCHSLYLYEKFPKPLKIVPGCKVIMGLFLNVCMFQEASNP